MLRAAVGAPLRSGFKPQDFALSRKILALSRAKILRHDRTAFWCKNGHNYFIILIIINRGWRTTHSGPITEKSKEFTSRGGPYGNGSATVTVMRMALYLAMRWVF